MADKLMAYVGWALKLWRGNIRWMSWNLFLGFVPLVLSIWLFRMGRSRSLLWWLGFCVFIAFLPNAPYVLTDVIHLIEDIRRGHSVWDVTLILIPQYLLFIIAGFEAYVLSLINLGHYLNQIGRQKWILGMELTLHGLSAIGIYLGRFQRFNSWDIVTQLDAVTNTVLNDLANKRPLVLIATTFVIITGLYWLFKQISLALTVYWKTPKSNYSRSLEHHSSFK